MIEWWVAALLGALGGVVADGSRLAGTMLSSKAMPWKGKQQRRAVALALIIRSGCAAALPSVVALQGIVGWSDQHLALFLLGFATPTVVQQGARIARVCARAILGELTAGGGGAP